MNKKVLVLLLFPLLVTSCATNKNKNSSGSGSGSQGESGSIVDIEPDEYDAWANSWSKPGHLYFHYNRGEKFGYENYCLWLWQHDPQDLEGALWGFSSDPKVSDKLTLQPMSTSYMTYEDVGKGSEGSGIFIDNYGAIIDVDYSSTTLKGGKTGKSTTYEGATELGFLIPQQNSMSGLTNWTSDGGRETYVTGIESGSSNWRTVEGGKALHLFVATGALDDFTFFAGEGTPTAKTNPIDEDTTGQYSSAVDTKYSNTLGNSSTAASFKDLGTGYQIFVASFRDSDGDGKGDLRGIIDAMDEGFFNGPTDDPGAGGMPIDVLWLTPIQKSDSYHGYDISDYYQVDKKFGTVDDYQELIYKAHKRGIRVLMDLVLNHTSKSNKWFINSQWGVEENGIKWRDVYTWKYENEIIEKWNGTSYEKITVKQDAESSNPSWYRDGESHYYYYGKFGSGMPEINYLSKATRELVINMAKYWLSFGLDGFRLDAVKHIFMRDECYQQGDIIIPDTGSKTSYNTDTGKVETKGFDYSSNITKNVMWWKEFAHGVKGSYPDCFLVGENFDGWGKQTAPYYQALDSQFSFSHYYHIPAYLYGGNSAALFASKQAGESYDVYSSTGMTELDGKDMYVPCGGRSDFIDGAFTSNHDVMRAINQANGSGTAAGTTPAEKVGNSDAELNKAKVHAAVTIFNQGISWIYYGDELGMSSNTDQHIPKYEYENCIDIWYRQPFLWNNTALRPNYKSGQYVFELDSHNLTLATYETQKSTDSSMWKFYEQLCKIKRQFPDAHKIQYHSSSSNDVMVIKVTGKGKSLVIYLNVGRTSGDYLMNPGEVLGTEVNNIWAYNAPSTAGGDIGHSSYGISVFQAAQEVTKDEKDIFESYSPLPCYRNIIWMCAL